MITIDALDNFPIVQGNCDLGAELIKTIRSEKFVLHDNDILCIASKLVSKSEGLFIDLNLINPSEGAFLIHKKVPRKDPRLIQVMLDQTEDQKGNRLQVTNNFIGGWLPNGLFLTSASVDKLGPNTVIVLPKNCDEIAKRISDAIFDKLKVRIAIIITDSDGRIDKKGATQVAVGLYGIYGLRKSRYMEKTNIETVCDMLAASAGLLMGQRGKMIPVVRISGLDYDFNRDAIIEDTVN